MNKGGKIALYGGLGVGLLALGLYGKKQFDMVVNDIWYDYDKTSVKVKKASLTDTQMTLDFIIDNRGKLEAEVKDVKIKIFTGDKLITDIVKNGDFRILPNQKVPINVTVALNPTDLVKNTFKGMKLTEWKTIPLTFKGRVKVKKLGIWIPVPFEFTYPIGDFL